MWRSAQRCKYSVLLVVVVVFVGVVNVDVDADVVDVIVVAVDVVIVMVDLGIPIKATAIAARPAPRRRKHGIRQSARYAQRFRCKYLSTQVSKFKEETLFLCFTVFSSCRSPCDQR